MIYLAHPYSHPDKFVEQTRYEAVMKWCVILEDRFPYSPIVHWHNIALQHDLPTTATFWQERNNHMLDLSRALYVIKLFGWEESSGLHAEVLYASLRNKPIVTVGPSPDDPIIHVTPLTLLDKMTHGKDYSKRGTYLRAVEGNAGGSD